MHPACAVLGHIVYQVQALHCVAACARKFPPFCFIRETSTGQTRSSARIPHTGYVESYPPSPSFSIILFISIRISYLFFPPSFSVLFRCGWWYISIEFFFFFSSLEKRDLTRLRIESLSWKLWNINVEIRLFFSLYFLSAVLEKYDLRLWALNFYSVCNWKGNKFF